MKKHIFSIVIFLFLVNNIEAQSNFYYANFVKGSIGEMIQPLLISSLPICKTTI